MAEAAGSAKLDWRGAHGASLLSKISFSWAYPLIYKANKDGQLELDDAAEVMPLHMRPGHVAAQFESAYQEVKHNLDGRDGNVTLRTLLWLHLPLYLQTSCFVALESGCRLAGPVVLFRFLSWMVADAGAGSSGVGQQEAYWGWVYALLLGVIAFMQAIWHAQVFWCGMHVGISASMQLMAAVSAKVLRLNGANVSAVSSGHLLNLVSTDAGRIQFAIPYSPFLWAGPAELAAVFVMVSLEVGWLPCLAGIATLLTIIPLQAWISRQLGALRGRAVEQADARMRLAGESVNGALAMKLLCWEQPLCAALSRLRAGEARALSHIGRIRASSMALEAVNTTIVTFVTFTVYTAMGGQLHVPRVFYVLSLLHLPKLFVCSFFVNAVQTATEAMVAVKRIDAFLATPEPRPPTNNSQPAAAAPASGAKQSDAGDHAVPGTVALRGADYDATRPLGVAAAADGAAGAARKAGAASVPPTAPSAPPTLQGIELRLQPGELLAVVGAVGCGKTCLLAALLGELQPLPAPGGDSPDAGSPDAELRSALVVGSLAYCQQVPWIKAGSVRDNIVFGRSDDFDPAHYAAVLAACALEPDLKELPAGDATELGERGVNLSGGQKARMALARAAYSRAAVQLLDDPLSAVDPRVGHILFERCIRGLMAGATRVLVTHQRQYLPKCDRLAVLRGGRLLALGTFEQVSAMGLPELSAAGGLALDADAVPSEEEEGGQGEGPAGRGEAGVTAAAPGEVAVQLPQLSTADLAVKEAGASGGQEDGGEGGGSGGAARRQQGSTPSAAGAKVGGGGGSGSLVKDEEREMGTIGWAVYAGLCRRMGIGAVATVACGLVAGQGAMLAAEYWLALWAKAPPDEQRRSVWVLIFGLLVAAVLALGLGRSLLFFQANVAAATRIHNDMAQHVLHAPLAFFHTNPAGRILNRFGRDLSLQDDQLPMTAFDALQSAFMVLGAFVLVSVAVPAIIPVFLPLAFLFYYYRQRYASRDVKRLEAITRSPLYASFSATLKGLPTIRAYSVQAGFHADFLRQMHANGSWWYSFMAIVRWIGFRLDFIAAGTLLAASLLAVALRGYINPAILGLALTHVLQLNDMMQWCLRQSAEVENLMTSVERMLEYSRLEQEPDISEQAAAAALVAKGWPASGALEYINVSARYRPGLPPVLQSVSFSLAGGTSAGVVGRTGSGKSSLMLTLFRLIELTQGSIRLAGVDTASLRLRSLRCAIAIIPQDPTLFSGTLRSNLDPSDKHSDAALWEALDAVQLKGMVEGLGGLATALAECGENLSAGQRQLFCLARALLQNAKILALDEATANVDRATDALIQQALLRFAGSSGGGGSGGSGGSTAAAGGDKLLLISAHRIDTILDCDTLLVLSKGRLVEQGPPRALAAQPGGIFAGMVDAAAAASASMGQQLQ